MSIQARFFSAIPGLLVATLAGCGGSVFIDDPSGTGGTGGDSGTTTTSNSTTSIEWTSYCLGICDSFNQAGCGGGSSVGECQKSCVDAFYQYAECQDELAAFYDCILDAVKTYGCSFPDTVCQAEMSALTTCLGGTATCKTNGCSTDSNYCSCDGVCNNVSVEATCKSAPDGTASCACYLDGNYAGECNDSYLSCDLTASCCSQFFPI